MEVFKKPWNVLSGIFGIFKVSRVQNFSCQLSQCDSQLEPSALHSPPQGHCSFFTSFLLLTAQFLPVSLSTSTHAPRRHCSRLKQISLGKAFPLVLLVIGKNMDCWECSEGGGWVSKGTGQIPFFILFFFVRRTPLFLDLFQKSPRFSTSNFYFKQESSLKNETFFVLSPHQ